MQKSKKMIRVGTWNIDQARREEQFPSTQFNVRWPTIKKQIIECDADILCLQELRNLETSTVTPDIIFSELTKMGYDYKHAYYGPDAISFCLCIFFKRAKFFPVGLDLQLLPLADESKPNISRIILSVKLRNILTDRVIDVCTTHLGLDEEEKRKSVEFLASYLSKKECYLCAGDFNFFDDRDGKQHREVLLRIADDLAYPLSNASGTFMGYDHDDFKQPFEKMSRLDHIFSKGVKRNGEAIAYGNMVNVKQRTYPSDHLMISINIEV